MNLKLINKLSSSRDTVYLFTAGFISILGQVVVLRELNVAFFGIELIYILSLGFWLIGTAIGAAAGKKKIIPDEKSVLTLFILTAFVLIVDIVFIRGLRNIFGAVPGAFLPFAYQITGILIPLLPLSFLTGMLFQYPAKLLMNNGGTLAKAYSIESAGGIAGGLASTLCLYFGMQNFLTALMCCSLSILTSVYYSAKISSRLGKIAAYSSLAAFILMILISSKLDKMLALWEQPSQIIFKDTPYGRLTITESQGQTCVLEDDAITYESESIIAEEFVQLSTLQAVKLQSVLVIGGGYGGLIAELLKLHPDKIDYIEINKDLISLIKEYLPSKEIVPLSNYKVNIIYDDPRQFLNLTDKYDFILIGMPEPASVWNNRFYTKEFFKQCAENLNEGGVIAFKIASAENLWTQQLTVRNKSIYAALKTVFENVIVLPGVTNIFIASKSRLITDVKILSDRFIESGVNTKLVSPQYINYLYRNDRFESIRKLLDKGVTEANSDLKPVSFVYTISIWLSKFFPAMNGGAKEFLDLKRPDRSPVLWLFAAIFVLLFLLTKKKINLAKSVLVFATGLAGMVMETVIILNYQNGNGILFQNIGTLLMSFMLVLTAGSSIIDKYFAKIKNHQEVNSKYGTVLFIVFAFICLLINFLISYNHLSSLLLTSIALIVVGGFVAAIFSFVSLFKNNSQNTAVSQLYSFDLAGGSIGSILAGLIFIPLYGIQAVILFMTVIILIISLFFIRMK